MLTWYDLKTLIESNHPDITTLVEVLGLTHDDILEAFKDRVIDRREEFDSTFAVELFYDDADDANPYEEFIDVQSEFEPD